jgi:hypothetical protein
MVDVSRGGAVPEWPAPVFPTDGLRKATAKTDQTHALRRVLQHKLKISSVKCVMMLTKRSLPGLIQLLFCVRKDCIPGSRNNEQEFVRTMASMRSAARLRAGSGVPSFAITRPHGPGASPTQPR